MITNRVKTTAEAREIWRRNGLAFGSSLPDYLFENAEALLKLEDKVAAARAAALESAAKATCYWCEQNVQAEPDKSLNGFGHFVDDGLQPRGERGRYVGCSAWKIRSLITSPPPPDARDAVVAELRRLSSWVRAGEGINRDDAIDEIARAIENRARDIKAHGLPVEGDATRGER